MNTTATLTALKDSEQDFEWYPTTDEMIEVVRIHMGNTSEHIHVSSILDIGAGDGRVLQALGGEYCSNLYAIEKAAIHIDNMPAEIAIVGTDFHSQTLIDKDVDVVFCNPPYSEYEAWAVKIIKESLCNRAYLILPQRWKDSKQIAAALELRKVKKVNRLWSGDFTNAERQARAVVDIICVEYRKRSTSCWDNDDRTDPFDAWFEETFPEVEAIDHVPPEPPMDKRLNGELLVGYNLVDRLAELYRQDLEKMNESYRALCKIDPALLKTIGVKAEQIKEGLKQKINSLKNKYWEELFDHLDKIQRRLTHASCKVIVEKMSSAVHVDFTSDNAYAIVLWVLKNANTYIESQVVELFKELSQPEHIKAYKSNQRTWGGDQWRYLKHPEWNHGKEETPSRYMLDYRIIAPGYQAIQTEARSWESYEYPGGLHRDAHARLDDICTIANNLGFECLPLHSERYKWSSGKAMGFHLDNDEVLVRVRAFMNGNMHYQFGQDFIKALNIEASRILGWIRSPQEACDEMDVDLATATRCFASNQVFLPDARKLLTA